MADKKQVNRLHMGVRQESRGREDIGRMKLSYVSAVGLLLAGAVGAWALDAPRTLHHARSAESHLTEPHRAASHHTAAHVAAKAAPVSRQARLTPRGQARASARRVAVTARRHHSYERFTASSFAKGDITAGDVTAGEDPVVRQAAIDAMGDMNGTAVVIDPSNGRILAMMPHFERLPLNNLWPWQPLAWKKLKASPGLKIFQNAREWCEQSRMS